MMCQILFENILKLRLGQMLLFLLFRHGPAKKNNIY